MPNGEIQPEFTRRLKAIGDWTDQYGPTIYGTRAGILPPQEWGVTTQKNGTQYLHILDAKEDTLFIRDFPGQLESAKLYKNGRQIKFKQIPEGVFLYLDDIDLSAVDTVVEMQVSRP